MSSIKDFELAQRIHIATHELKSRIAALEAERDALAKDAERYRWLRDVGDKTWTPFCQRLGWHSQGFNMDRRIDATIDAALTKEQT